MALTLGLPVLFSTVAILARHRGTGVHRCASSQKNLDPNDYQDGRYIVRTSREARSHLRRRHARTRGHQAGGGQEARRRQGRSQEVRGAPREEAGELAGQKNVKIKRQFTAAVNGFSANLTADQAISLAKDPGVLVVAPDTENAPDYSSTDFLKLSGPNGTWNTKFGGQDGAGKGVVVGVIDTGYTPSSPFFAGEQVQPLVGDPVVGIPYRTDDGKIAMLKSDGGTFVGECQKGVDTGADFDGSACNSKVLARALLRRHVLGVCPGRTSGPRSRRSHRSTSTATARTRGSTAVGNANVETFVDGRSFGLTSGIAPAAKLSVYKVCWEDTDPNTGGCYSSASVAAIDQAIYDGVDVLNYSISGSTSTTTDPVSMAFLSAASAGIFVAASAGNSGPTASTVNHGGPLGHHRRGEQLLAGTPGHRRILGRQQVPRRQHHEPRGEGRRRRTCCQRGRQRAGDPNAALCGPDTLDPAKVAGKVVVCDRGVFDRVAKSAEVARGGGVGMILVNLTSSSLDTDKHSIPTVHVNPPATEDH